MPIGSSTGQTYEDDTAHALGIPMELPKKNEETIPIDQKYNELPLSKSVQDRRQEGDFGAGVRDFGSFLKDPIQWMQDYQILNGKIVMPKDWRDKFNEQWSQVQPEVISKAQNRQLDIQAESKAKWDTWMAPIEKIPENWGEPDLPINKPQQFISTQSKKEEIPITAPAKDESLQNIDNWYLIKEIPKFIKSLQEPKNQELLNEIWSVKAVKGLVESAKGLMDPMPAPGTRPEDFTDIPNVDTHPNIGRIADIAGLITLGPAPLAGKLAQGTLGSFAGVKAVGTDFKALTKAQEMLQSGKSATEIWKDTGFFKGLDNKWRWEIPGAEKMALHEDMPLMGKLDQYVDYPELFKAYPHLKNVDVILDHELIGPNNKPVFGGINEAGDLIVLNPAAIENHKFSMEDTFIHEIQHIIQRKEGFPLGTNPKAAIDESERALQKRLLDRIELLTNQGKKIEERRFDPEYTEMKDIMKFLRSGSREDFSYYLYHATPGELEANLAMKRGGMSETFKKAVSPNQTLGMLRMKDPETFPPPFRIPEGTASGSQSMISPPVKPLDRIWQNYVKNMSPEEMLSSEPVWSTAKNISTQLGISESEAFAKVANDMFQRMGANRYITPEIARKYMGKERGIKLVK